MPNEVEHFITVNPRLTVQMNMPLRMDAQEFKKLLDTANQIVSLCEQQTLPRAMARGENKMGDAYRSGMSKAMKRSWDRRKREAAKLNSYASQASSVVGKKVSKFHPNKWTSQALEILHRMAHVKPKPMAIYLSSTTGTKFDAQCVSNRRSYEKGQHTNGQVPRL